MKDYVVWHPDYSGIRRAVGRGVAVSAGRRPSHVTIARRQLAEHLATRPATPEEARDIAADHRARAAALREDARRLREMHARTPSDPLFGGHRHEAVAASDRCKDAMECDRRAADEDSHARAWDVVASLPEGQAWEETREALEARVAYYEAEYSRSHMGLSHA